MSSKPKESSKCGLCNVDLVSIEEQLEHDFSLMHHMQLHQKHSKLKHRCSLCHCQIGTIKSYVSHLSGNNHQKALKRSKQEWEKCPPTVKDLDQRCHVVNYSQNKDYSQSKDYSQNKDYKHSKDYIPSKFSREDPKQSTSYRGRNHGNNSSTINNYSNKRYFNQDPAYCNNQFPNNNNYTNFGNSFSQYTPPNYTPRNYTPRNNYQAPQQIWRNTASANPYGKFHAYNTWNWLQPGQNPNESSWNQNFQTGNWSNWNNPGQEFNQAPVVNPIRVGNNIQLTSEPETSGPHTERSADHIPASTSADGVSSVGLEKGTTRHHDKEAHLQDQQYDAETAHNSSLKKALFCKSAAVDNAIMVSDKTVNNPTTKITERKEDEEENEEEVKDSKAAILKQIQGECGVPPKSPRVKTSSKVTLFLSSDSETDNDQIPGVDTGQEDYKRCKEHLGEAACSSDIGEDPKQNVEKGKDEPYSKALLSRLVNFPCNRKQQLQLAKWVQQHSKNKKKLLFPRFNLQLVPPDSNRTESEADLKQVLSEMTDLPMEAISALVEALKQEEGEFMDQPLLEDIEGAREEPQPKLSETDNTLPRDHVGEPQIDLGTIPLPNVYIKPDPDAPENASTQQNEENIPVPEGFIPVDMSESSHSQKSHTSPKLPTVKEHSSATLESQTSPSFESPASSRTGKQKPFATPAGIFVMQDNRIPNSADFFASVSPRNVSTIRQPISEQENITIQPDNVASNPEAENSCNLPHVSPSSNCLNRSRSNCTASSDISDQDFSDRESTKRTTPRVTVGSPESESRPSTAEPVAGTSSEGQWMEMPSWIRRPSPEPPLVHEMEEETSGTKPQTSDPHSIVDQLLNLNKEEEQLREQAQKADQLIAQMYEVIEEWKQKKVQIQQREVDMRQRRQKLLQILQGTLGHESSDDAAASSTCNKTPDPSEETSPQTPQNEQQNVTYLGTLDSAWDIMQQLGMNMEPDSSNITSTPPNKRAKKNETKASQKKKETTKKTSPGRASNKGQKRKVSDAQSSEEQESGKPGGKKVKKKKKKMNEAAQQASMLQELLFQFAKDSKAENTKKSTSKVSTAVSADSSVTIVAPTSIETFGPLEAHASAVLDIKIGNGYLYTCSADKTAKRFDMNDLLNCVVYDYHDKTVSSIQLVSNEEKGDVIFTASHDGYLRCFEAQSGSVIFSHYTGSPVLCLTQAWGQLFLGLSNGQIWPYKISTGKFLDIFESSISSVSRIATGSEGSQKLLCIITYDGSVTIRNALTGLLIRLLDKKVRPPCCLQVDGSEIFITTTDRSICVYDLTSGRLLKKVSCPSAATGLHVLRKYVLSCSFDGFIRCYRRKDWTLHRIYYGAGKAMAMCFEVSSGWMFSGNRHGIVEAIKTDHSINSTCYFDGCKLPFGYWKDLRHHLKEDHLKTLSTHMALQYVRCPWGDCTHLLRGTSGQSKIKELENHVFQHVHRL